MGALERLLSFKEAAGVLGMSERMLRSHVHDYGFSPPSRPGSHRGRELMHFNTMRFAIGRALIHAGLRVMPHGRPRRELTEMMTAWGVKVRAIVAADLAMKAPLPSSHPQDRDLNEGERG